MIIKKKRDLSFDLLRLFGIFVIMIAHAHPPSWLLQIRNFGTPMLIIASAMTYSIIYAHKEVEIKSFYKKRLSNLTIPTWYFLSFFFIFFYLWFFIIGEEFPFSTKEIVLSYTFISGIGFVWIFKVYIILALVTPFAIWFKKNIKNDYRYMITITIIYIIYEITYYLIYPIIPDKYNLIFDKLIILFVPYILLFMYGLKLREFSNRLLLILSFIFFIIFLFMSVYLFYTTGIFIETQQYKYPPQLYYLSYSLFAIHLIYFFCRKLLHVINEKIVTWLATNALWIYLWHIFAYYIWEFTIGDIKQQLFSTIIKASFLFGTAIIFAYMQSKLTVKLKRQKND